MKPTTLAPAIIVVVRDTDGFGPAISDALQPRPDSGITREIHPFELSLEKYGITDRIESVDLIQFVDAHGSPQVSILLLPNYEPPIAACAVKEVLASISLHNFSNQPTIIIPLVVDALKANREMTNRTISDQEVTLYGTEIGPTNELSQMIRVLNLSTVLLASSGQDQHKRSKGHELEALCTIGQSLANHVGLSFSKDRLLREQFEKPKADKEPWRALYG